MEGVGPEIRPNPYGDDDRNKNGVHPLLVDLVLQKVFSFSTLQDLLTSRRVCRAWCPLATQELRAKDGLVAVIGSNEEGEEDEKKSMTNFVRDMTPALTSEAGMPLTRIDLSIDVLRETNQTMELLSVISPWVQGIGLYWLESELGASSNQVEEVIREMEGGFQGLSFPALKELEVGNNFGYEHPQPQGLDFANMILVKGLISGAKELTWYEHYIRFALDDARHKMLMSDVIRALPISLKKLEFWQDSSVDFAALSNCHFQLESYWDITSGASPSSSPKDVLAFLLRQSGTLRELRVGFLDHLYHNVHPTFPLFPLVTWLRTEVCCRSRFKWIRKFPALHHLELNLRYRDGSRLAQHQGVRSLRIRPIIEAPMVRFDIPCHVIPNLAFLDLTVSWGFEREVAHLCTHMVGLEMLKLEVQSYPVGSPDLEAILCGLPLRVEEGETSRPVFGLANLQKLKRLEVTGGSQEFKLFFTPLTLFHAFRLMGELKEIRLDKFYPQAVVAVADIIQELRSHGIQINEIYNYDD